MQTAFTYYITNLGWRNRQTSQRTVCYSVGARKPKRFCSKKKKIYIYNFSLEGLTFDFDLMFVHPCQAGFVCVWGVRVLIRGLLFCVISLDMHFPASGCDTTQSASPYQIDPTLPHFSGSSPKVSFVKDQPMAAVCVWTLADKGNISNKWTKSL